MLDFLRNKLKLFYSLVKTDRPILPVFSYWRILVVYAALLSSTPLLAITPKEDFKVFLTSIIEASNTRDANVIKEFRDILLKHQAGLQLLSNDALFGEFAMEMDLPQGSDFLKEFDAKVAEELEKQLSEQLVNLTPEQLSNLNNLSRNTRRYGLKAFLLLPRKTQEEILYKIPNSYLLQLKGRINTAVDTFDVNSLPGLADIAPKSGEVIEGLDPKQLEEFVQLIKKYFNNLPLTQKKKILSGFIRLPAHPETSDKIAVALNGAGPLVQKLFQLVGKKHPNPTVRKASQKLLESVEEIHAEEIKIAIEKRFEKPLGTIFKSFDPKPIATATVGQVHKAVLWSGEVVAVKIRKPGLLERVTSELEFLEKIAPDSLKATIRAMKNAIFEEMDFRIEAENLKKGRSYKNQFLKDLAVRVPQIPKGIEPFEDILISEFMTGSSLSKVLEETHPTSKDLNALCSIGKAVEDFTSVWLWRAFKGDGFSHVDLHGGNVKIKEEEGKYYLELLDFGSTTALSSEEVNIFVLLTVSALHGDEILLRKTISNLERYNKTKIPEKMKNALLKIVRDKSKPWDKKAAEMFYELSLGKSYVPPNSAQFFRGLLFLQQHFENINERIDKADPWKLYPRYGIDIALQKGIRPYLNGKTILLGFGNNDSINAIFPDLMASVARTKTQSLSASLHAKCSLVFKKVFGKE